MRLQELFLTETTVEDRLIISLSSAIYKIVSPYGSIDPEYDNPDDEAAGLLYLGKIKDLVPRCPPEFGQINIQLQTSEKISNRSRGSNADSPAREIYGVWDNSINGIVLNIDHISSRTMQTIISHELRHALDDIKSEYKANNSSHYSTPRNPIHRKGKDTRYLAEPAEINARFVEVMHELMGVIRRLRRTAEPDQVRPRAMRELDKLLKTYDISDLFPEKTKSKSYQRLIKRSLAFIDNELSKPLLK
jgi:hypothetical protein